MNNVDDLLNKIDRFLSTLPSPSLFERKPAYISVIEKELTEKKLKLKEGEYIKVSVNPFSESLSLLTVYNFLSDRIFETYEKDLVIGKTTIPTAFESLILSIYFHLYKEESDLLIIHLRGKQYVYILRVNSDKNEFDDLLKNLLEKLEQSIIDGLDIKLREIVTEDLKTIREGISLVQLYDDSGSAFILTPRVGYRDEDLNRTAFIVANKKWSEKTVQVNINEKSFRIRVQFKKRGNHALIFIPGNDVIELLDFAITNSFKEKIVSL